MAACRNGRMSGAELAQLLPVLDQLSLVSAGQLLPVHVRAQRLIEHPAIFGEPPAGLVAVVELDAARQQHKAVGDPAL